MIKCSLYKSHLILTPSHENTLTFLNKDRYKIRVKGRGTRKYHGNGQNLPLKYAEHFAVYIDTKTFDQNNPAYYYQKDYQVRCKLRELRDEINRLLK